jgi:predicted lipoprotein with Yx(FWY)xxD motif
MFRSSAAIVESWRSAAWEHLIVPEHDSEAPSVHDGKDETMMWIGLSLALGVGLALGVPSDAESREAIRPFDQALPGEGVDASDSATGQQVSTVTLRSTDHEIHGPYLKDDVGRALYVFTQDQQGNSNCLGKCIEVWPPLIKTGVLRAVGIDERLMSTSLRDGGIRQVTYAGRPLYYYVAELGPGNVTAHGLEGFGGTWHLLSPSGDPIN